MSSMVALPKDGYLGGACGTGFEEVGEVRDGEDTTEDRRRVNEVQVAILLREFVVSRDQGAETRGVDEGEVRAVHHDTPAVLTGDTSYGGEQSVGITDVDLTAEVERAGFHRSASRS
jgi:hypothetical protein